MTTGPTPEQIAQVQSNLKNMQAFNDFVYNQGGGSRILNAYLSLSEPDPSDPGLNIGLNIIEGAFWAIGGMFGPVGNFTASFLSGMLSWWANSENTPPNLNTTFASLSIRTQQTSLAVDTQLAVYYQDVVTHWNDQFTYNGQTVTLGDLANYQFPAETDPDFEKMATASIFALDQTIWTYALKANFVITLYELSSGPNIFPGDQGDPPVSWDEMFIKQNPSYYNTWDWHASEGCGDTSGWLINEYNIGTGAGVFTDGAMSNDACAYLFIDSYNGVVINANGLFSRKTVFTGLGLRTDTHVCSNISSGIGEISFEYKKAMVKGQTLGKLIERVGRSEIERMIIEKVHSDSVFARNVSVRPRQTLEEFLGVKIPETVSIGIILENAGTFALVVPSKPEPCV